MKELKCLNCNSRDLKYTDGVWVCQNCGSKFIPDADEAPKNPENSKKNGIKKRTPEEIKDEQALSADLLSLYDTWMGLMDELMGCDAESKKWDKLYSRYKECQWDIRDTIGRIFEINSHNPYALAVSALDSVEDPAKIEKGKLNEVVAKMKDALISSSSPEERDKIVDILEADFFAHKKDFLEVDSSLSTVLDEIEYLLRGRD